jgi:hypothetical protein
MFLAYLKSDDFPGADMARKFLQMGWTRSRRYANHKGGRKYDKKTGEELPRTEDNEKAAAAAVFYERYVTARQHAEYVRQKKRHQEQHETGSGLRSASGSARFRPCQDYLKYNVGNRFCFESFLERIAPQFPAVALCDWAG